MLFNRADVVLHSGVQSDWIIDCRALNVSDLEALAFIGSRIVAPFSAVVGVPRGGLRFADVMAAYAQPAGGLLVVDDVLTTGGSMIETMTAFGAQEGLVIFARGELPALVKAIWVLDASGRNRGET